MLKEQLLIILPDHAWTYKYVKELGYNLHSPYYGTHIIPRVFREIFFRLNLPGKKCWYKKLPQKDYNVIILYEALITKDYLRWVQKKYLTKRIIVLYTNPVSKKNSSILNQSNVEYWSYDEDDSKKNKMNFLNCGGYFPQWKIEKKQPEIDVFYVGKDKNRLKKLQAIENQLNEYGINTFFYITWEKSWQKKQDGIHKPFLPYEGVLNYLGKSRAILHLIEGAQHGITIRIQESLIHGIKLITDDRTITKYDFYNTNNIFILGKDDLKDLRTFLDTPYKPILSSFLDHAFYDQLIDTILCNSPLDSI